MNNKKIMERTPHEHLTVNKVKKITQESAILLSGVLISVSILLHGVIVAELGGLKTTATGLVDKNIVSQILKTPVLAHRYFGDQTPTEEIVFTEYSDTECPFCKNFHSTLSQIVTEGNGKVAWVYKYFPLSFHPNAQKEAEAIECVREIEGDTKAFQFMDVIFAITPSNNKLPKDALFEISDAMKLHTKKIRECTDSGKYTAKVKAQEEEGVKLGVSGTPYTFVTQTKDGQKNDIGGINGAQPLDAVQAVLSQAK